MIWCSTPSLGWKSLNPVPMMSGNSANKEREAGGTSSRAVNKEVWQFEVTKGRTDMLSARQINHKFVRNQKFWPRIGRSILARIKGQSKRWSANWRRRFRITFLSAAGYNWSRWRGWTLERKNWGCHVDKVRSKAWIARRWKKPAELPPTYWSESFPMASMSRETCTSGPCSCTLCGTKSSPD